MPEEVIEKEPEAEVDSFYDEVRADIETAVYAYATLMEIDFGMQDKQAQNRLKKAKDDCVIIMCKALNILKQGYCEEE